SSQESLPRCAQWPGLSHSACERIQVSSRDRAESVSALDAPETLRSWNTKRSHEKHSATAARPRYRKFWRCSIRDLRSTELPLGNEGRAAAKPSRHRALVTRAHRKNSPATYI